MGGWRKYSYSSIVLPVSYFLERENKMGLRQTKARNMHTYRATAVAWSDFAQVLFVSE